jgi:hypothetical protein
MDDIRTVLLKHYDRYPLMELGDFLKLIFQDTFGPRHFSANPSLETIRSYLAEELNTAEINPAVPLVEDIGGNYVRVSLDCVRLGKVSAEDLASMFFVSMSHCPVFNDRSIRQFKEKTGLLLALIQTGDIRLPYETCRASILAYNEGGIRPTHHSQIYNQMYHPHYRVIHKTFLSEVLK